APKPQHLSAFSPPSLRPACFRAFLALEQQGARCRSHLAHKRNLSVVLRADPALLRDVEDDAIGILKFALEILFCGILAEIEKEGAAIGLDALLGFLQIVNLKPEMVSADEGACVIQA